MKNLLLFLINLLTRFVISPYESYCKERKKKKDYDYLVSHGVETEFGFVTLLGTPIICKCPNSHIRIGKGVTLVSDSNFNIAGINHPCILSTVRPNAEIMIEDGCGISGAVISCATKVILKKGVGLGANVCVYDHDFHGVEPYNRCNPIAVKSACISIGDYSWIGANSTILKGVNIGRAAVVGACSLVSSDVQELSVYAGNPAKFIKKIEVDDDKYKSMF